MKREELQKKTKCEIINLILEIKPKLYRGKLWCVKKQILINYYIKIKEGSK